MTRPTVQIHYVRPPDRKDVFHQRLLVDESDVKITLATDLQFEPPLRIDGRTALETGSSVVWFTFPGEWHDIGLFHLADGRFSGTYANILTPPDIRANGVWHTTDLYLDLWIDPEGALVVLDQDQFDAACEAGWIDADTRDAAMVELTRLIRGFSEGTWPPPIVRQWSLDRARRIVPD